MKKITICINNSRLDRYLKRIFPFLTHGNIETLLRKKDIRLNGRRAKSAERLQEGDEITYFSKILDGHLEKYKDSKRESQSNADLHSNSKHTFHSYEKRHFLPNVISLAKKILGEYLVFDCGQFIVIDKPHGLAVQGGSKISISVADSLEYLNHISKMRLRDSVISNPDFLQSGINEYKIVHRLDKHTSGLLIIAKGYDNAVKLAQGFKDRVIQKAYIAIISNFPKEKHGKISGFMGKKREYKDDRYGNQSDILEINLLSDDHSRSKILEDSGRQVSVLGAYIADTSNFASTGGSDDAQAALRRQLQVHKQISAKLGVANVYEDKPAQSTHYAASDLRLHKKSIVEELPESDHDAKFALTEYEVIKTFTIDEAMINFSALVGVSGVAQVSLIEYKPYTGRMHQLRVHSKLLGCPIIGDVKYGGVAASRMMLHAKRIRIPSDVFGVHYDIESKFDFTN